MDIKQEHLIVGLLGVGAAVVIYLLWRDAQAAAVPAAIPGPPEGSTISAYPNVAPIAPASFNINGFNPDSVGNVPVNGVQIPRVDIGAGDGEGGCCENECADAGVLQSIQTIPPHVLDRAVSDLGNYQQKFTSSVDAAMFAPAGTLTPETRGSGQ